MKLQRDFLIHLFTTLKVIKNKKLERGALKRHRFLQLIRNGCS